MKLGNPATGEDFFGRTQELCDLWRYLETEHIRFPGVRRLGKTSILRRLEAEAAEHGLLAKWLDVSNINTAKGFVTLLDCEFPEQVGWLSPYFLCLLLDECIRAARERRQECPSDATSEARLEIEDVDDAYEKLLAERSRFHHWEKRLKGTLMPNDQDFCLSLLTYLSRFPEGLTLNQLRSRLAKREPDPDLRAQRLQDLLVRLTDEGYTSTPDGNRRIQFLSFPLRDWWNRNHV